MRKIAFVIALLGNYLSYSQKVTIPDQEFVNYLTFHFPACMTDNQLDTQCPNVLNTKQLVFRSFQYPISDFSGLEHFVNLENLQCYSFAGYSIKKLPSKLKMIGIASDFTGAPSGLQSFPNTLPPTLQSLSIRNVNCNLSFLDVPATLQTLFIADAKGAIQIGTLPKGLQSFTIKNTAKVNVRENMIDPLPTFPDSLINLTIENINRTNFGVFPNSLQTLSLASNKLSELPVLPSKLLSLDVSNNELQAIPRLDSLRKLYVQHNKLPLLVVPAKVQLLDCSYNSLTSLALEGNDIVELNARHNMLAYLYDEPHPSSSIRKLDLTYNLLTSFAGGNNLQEVHLDSNKLEQINQLPEGLNILTVKSNYLKELPILPNSLCSLEAKGNAISCLKNIPTASNPYPCGRKESGLMSDISQTICTVTELEEQKVLADFSLSTSTQGIVVQNYHKKPLKATLYAIDGTVYGVYETFSDIEIPNHQLKSGLTLLRLNDNVTYKVIR